MRHTDLERIGGALAIQYGSDDLQARSGGTDTGIYPLGRCSFLIIFRFDKDGILQGFSRQAVVLDDILKRGRNLNWDLKQ